MIPSRRAALLQLGLVPALFYAGVKLSLMLAVMPEVVVMMWLPNSLLLAALLHFGYRRYGYFAALVLVAEIAADYPTFPIVQSALFGAINVMEVTLAFALLRAWRFDAGFSAPPDIAKFLGAGPIIGSGAAAVCAAAVYRYFASTDTGYLHFMRVWWFSDAIGLLIVTPLVLSLWPPVGSRADEPLPIRWFDGIAMLAALGIVGMMLFSRDGMFHGMPVRPSWMLPVAIYAAARFSPRVAIIAVGVMAGVLLWITHNGQQPYGALPAETTVLQVQQFVLAMAVTSLGLASLLAQLRANRRELEGRVAARTAELQAANEQLQKLAVTDPLTGLLNRRALFDLLRREMERSARHGHPLAVAMFDIDHFKNVNDEHGHAVGDELLRHVAMVAADTIRATDSVARYGGEEFVLVAPETDTVNAQQLADRVRAAIDRSAMVLNGCELRVTASFGVAVLQPADDRPDRLLARADAALYRAKSKGRNTVVVEGEAIARA